VACAVAARRGAAVAGLDVAEALIDLARERVPGGEFCSGEMEALPYPDGTFDVITGFNAFQYAASPVHALREAGRVTRPGGTVAIVVWGEAAACEAAGYLGALGSFLHLPPPGTPGPFALSVPGALERLAETAGLQPTRTRDVDTDWVYPDLATALRGLLAAGPAVKAIATAGEGPVGDAVAAAIAPYRQPTGSYRLRNRWHTLFAVVP
jgi:SAM-dependent methyltransferase